jgi:hypothetical protein
MPILHMDIDPSQTLMSSAQKVYFTSTMSLVSKSYQPKTLTWQRTLTLPGSFTSEYMVTCYRICFILLPRRRRVLENGICTYCRH